VTLISKNLSHTGGISADFIKFISSGGFHALVLTPGQNIAHLTSSSSNSEPSSLFQKLKDD